MREWVWGLPAQIVSALDACRTSHWPPDGSAPRSILVCGMGGSAMAGDMARAVLRDRLSAPVEVLRDPAVPAWVGPQTLVLALSYSGNTWETLRAARTAYMRGGRVIAIASGGALIAEARDAGWPYLLVPSGYAPRAAIGWMTVPAVLGALVGNGCSETASEVISELAESAALLAEEVAHWRSGGSLPGRDPLELAAAIAGRFAFVYAPTERMLPAAVRWRGQLQENAKQAACAAAFPELAHNEITGWHFAVEAISSVHILLEDDPDAKGNS
jgi:glucose/mannose-6-phosphate isomerase